MRLPLQIDHPRRECWQVNLQFGPHCFRLLEYETEESARIAMRSIETNWKGFSEKHSKAKKYIANPVEVEAHKIVGVGERIRDAGPNFQLGYVYGLHLCLENGENVMATPEMLARMTPVPGDYWVIQADGYIYLNPKDVFERKYKEKE